MEICRAIDTIVLSAQHQKDDVIELTRYGANKAISLFIDESCRAKRAPIFPSNQQTIQWAFSVLHHCGRIAYCEKLLEYERAGLGKFFCSGEEVQFEVTTTYVGLEALEVEEFDWAAELIAKQQQPLLSALEAAQPGIHARMKDLVYCWADHLHRLQCLT